MNDRIKRQRDSFEHLATFTLGHTADFSPTSALPGLAGSLQTILGQIDKDKAGQLGGGVDVSGGLLGAMLADLQLYGNLARNLDADHPGLKDKFPTVGTTEQSILTTADAYLAELEIGPDDDAAKQAAKSALAALFIAHEAPATFVQDLRDDRDAIPTAVAGETTKSDDQIKSTASLDQLAHEGMKLRGQILAGLRLRYSREKETLRAAESAAHVERAPQRAKKTPPPATSGGTTPPA